MRRLMSRKFGLSRNLSTDTQKAAGPYATLRLVFNFRVCSIHDDYMIDHTQVAHVCVINTHAGAGLDRCLDDFSRLIHNVTTSVENKATGTVRTVLPNNECTARLITRSRAFLACCSDVVPVTFTGSVVLAACFLSVELGWANASGAISKQPSITISFFMVRLLLLMVCFAEAVSGRNKHSTRATSRVSHGPLWKHW